MGFDVDKCALIVRGALSWPSNATSCRSCDGAVEVEVVELTRLDLVSLELEPLGGLRVLAVLEAGALHGGMPVDLRLVGDRVVGTSEDPR